MPKRKRKHRATSRKRIKPFVEEDEKYSIDQKCSIYGLNHWNDSWDSEQLNYVVPKEHKKSYYGGYRFPWDDRSVKKCEKCKKYTRNQFYMVTQNPSELLHYPKTYFRNHYGVFSHIYMTTNPYSIVHTYCEHCQDIIMESIRMLEDTELQTESSVDHMLNCINTRKRVHKQQHKLIHYIRSHGYAENIWNRLSADMQQCIFTIYCCYTPKYFNHVTKRTNTVVHDLNAIFAKCVVYVKPPKVCYQEAKQDEPVPEEITIAKRKQASYLMFSYQDLGFLPLQELELLDIVNYVSCDINWTTFSNFVY